MEIVWWKCHVNVYKRKYEMLVRTRLLYSYYNLSDKRPFTLQDIQLSENNQLQCGYTSHRPAVDYFAIKACLECFIPYIL